MAQNELNSPFVPGHAVPPHMFTGRIKELKFLYRNLRQSFKKPQPRYILIKGDRGSGKSSLALYVKEFATGEFQSLSVYTNIGGVKTTDDVILRIIESIGREGNKISTLKDKIFEFLGEGTFKMNLFGFLTFNKEVAKKRFNVQNITHFIQKFVLEVLSKKDRHGLLLILDDINGVSKEAQFAGFLKSLVDTIAVETPHLPFMLIICATEEKWTEVIESHESVSRIFDHVELGPMKKDEVKEFYRKAFSLVNIQITNSSLELMYSMTQGYPALVQELGDAVFWVDEDGKITETDVMEGLREASERIGRKYFRHVYETIKSERYRKILSILAKHKIKHTFTKNDLKQALKKTNLSDSDINNFIRRFKDLGILKSTGIRGQYQFSNIFLYIYTIFFYNAQH